jgi:signal peptidase II
MTANPRQRESETGGQPPAPAGEPRAARGLAWPLIIAVTLCDQTTKLLMLRSLLNYPSPNGHEVIPGLFYLHLKTNTGVAFSLFENHPGALTYITTAAVLLIGVWAWSIPRSDRMSRTSFGLILGGALGNLIDRYTRGHVIDFLDFIFPGVLGRWHRAIFGTEHFATFNLADTAICLGMGLLILSLFFTSERAAAPAEIGDRGSGIGDRSSNGR